jgi:hypothetical protein
MCECELFQQDDATIVTADNLVSALPKLFGQQIISRLLWFAILPESYEQFTRTHKRRN